jgi:hypothetical protein
VAAAARTSKQRAAAPRTPAVSGTPIVTQTDDRALARALSLAAIALLLVVIAGGSLLRLTMRGRVA